MNQITTEITHSGVKGMKWGVRKDKGHEGEQASNRKIAKLDKKFERNSNTLHTAIKIHNRAAQLTNDHDIERINNLPKYKAAAENGGFLKDSPLRQKYYADHQRAFLDNVEKAAGEFGVNASGTKKLSILETGDGGWQVVVQEIKHSGIEDFVGLELRVIKDKNGKILRLEPVDNTSDNAVAHGEDFAEGYFLKHYGIKGMRWGVRRDKTPTDVAVNTRPGKLVKAKGGTYQPAAEDAIRAARIRQQAKKSSVDSLSNAELKVLVERMNLESQYNRLKDDPERLSTGTRLMKGALENGGAEIAVMGVAKGAAMAGLAANPHVAVGLKVSSMIANRLTEKAIVKSGNSRELQKFDAKHDPINKLKPGYAAEQAAKAAKLAKKAQ